MSQKRVDSFLNWEKQFRKKPKNEAKEVFTRYTFDSFIRTIPAWQSKKNYAQVHFLPREFKLFGKNKLYLKNFIKYLLQIYLFVDPNNYNQEIQQILNDVYHDKKGFRKVWNEKLRVY